MRRTLDALVRQTLQPTAIVAVDDGSTDKTPEILAEFRPAPAQHCASCGARTAGSAR